MEAAELPTEAAEWVRGIDRGGLLYPFRRTFDWFLLFRDRLKAQDMASLQQQATWDQHRPSLITMIQSALPLHGIEPPDPDHLAFFADAILGCYRRIWCSGLARKRRDLARETEYSLADYAGLEPRSLADASEAGPSSAEADSAGYQSYSPVPPGSRNLPLRLEIARRASLPLNSAADTLEDETL